MFCPKCGKELPDNAKFCAHCGKSILGGDQQSPDQAIMQDHAAPKQDSSNAVIGKPWKSVIIPQKKSRNIKVFIGLAAISVKVIEQEH